MTTGRLLHRSRRQNAASYSGLLLNRRLVGFYSAVDTLAETINGLYKAELIHWRAPWKSFEAVEFETLKWVDWFNNKRLLERIGHIPPAEAEELYYAALDKTPIAA